jgi:two-component sensor histidine kinase
LTDVIRGLPLALPEHIEPDIPVDLVVENANLRAALAVSEDAGIQRELVSQELKHRIGNLLTVVAAIARKTFRDSDAANVADFTARLAALAAAQKLLIDAETHPATLADVITAALAPHAAGGRCNASGPIALLSGRRAHGLALAIHELATNAAKYGALSVEDGRVEVTWCVAGELLDLSWRESGGPPVSTPTRRGLGSSLITQNLQSTFSGTVELSYQSEGLECRLRAPLRDGAE